MAKWQKIQSWLRTGLRRAISDDAGNVAILFALTLPIVIGGAGLGVETSYWYYRSLQLQSSADAAAYAGQLEKVARSSSAAIVSSATSLAIENGFEAATGRIEVFTPPSTGSNTKANAVEVILHQDIPRYFTSIFIATPVVLKARAVARSAVASKACVLALSASASKAALFSGSANLTLTGCAIMSNSTASDAIKVQGSAKLSVSCLMSAGGVDLGFGAVSTTCPGPITHTQPAPDPFADLPTPDTTRPCQSANGATLQPGTYCRGLTIRGDTTLAAGTYVISGGDFSISANANIFGTGVTIYLTCGSRVTMNGTATVRISAPTTGTYAGILFFNDRSCEGGSNTFNGTSSSLLTGALYFAKQDVSFLGNFSGNGGCSQIVAGTIQWSGNTSISQDCTSLGMRDLPANQIVQLVE